jgi:vacuolar-type H+-ATPase subunit I/STV1
MQIAAEDDCPDGEFDVAECCAAPTGPRSLLEELDARQDEVIDELEKLNGRIEKVISEWRGETDEKPALPTAA